MVKRCKFTAQKKPQTSRHEGNITCTISYGNEIDLENTPHHQTIVDNLEFFEIRSGIESIDFSYEDVKKKANTESQTTGHSGTNGFQFNFCKLPTSQIPSTSDEINENQKQAKYKAALEALYTK